MTHVRHSVCLMITVYLRRRFGCSHFMLTDLYY